MVSELSLFLLAEVTLEAGRSVFKGRLKGRCNQAPRLLCQLLNQYILLWQPNTESSRSQEYDGAKTSLDYSLKTFNRKRSSCIDSYLFSSIFPSSVWLHGFTAFLWCRDEMNPSISTLKTSRDVEGLYFSQPCGSMPILCLEGRERLAIPGTSWKLCSEYFILSFGDWSGS